MEIFEHAPARQIIAILKILQKTACIRQPFPILRRSHVGNGLVAQLEERLNGIEEVVSSNLIGSTNFRERQEDS